MFTIVQGCAFAAIYLASYAIRFDGVIPNAYAELAWRTLPLVVVLKLAASFTLRVHRGSWISASFDEISGQAEATTLGSFGFVIAACLFQLVVGTPVRIPRAIFLIDWAATVIAICGARVALRLVHERYAVRFRPRRKVLILGPDEAGIGLARQLAARPELGLNVVGFLHPEGMNRGRIVSGKTILGGPTDLAWIAPSYRPEAVLISPDVPPQQVRDATLACEKVGVETRVIPRFEALISGKFTAQPREVDVRELLRRPPVSLDVDTVRGLIRGKVVLVTGAAGSIGSEICRQVLALEPKRLVLLDISENGLYHIERELRALHAGGAIAPCVASITDAKRLRAIFEEHRPDAIFHAAAHKHVPMMEENRGESVKNNVLGTRTLVDESIRARVGAFVMISTDKAVRPRSTMGVCKRLAELYVQSLAGRTKTRFVVVRFGNVLGSNGSVVPLFQEQIRRGGPVTVTHPEMTRYFMTIPEAATLVLQAAATGRGGEIFVLDMGEPVKILDLAHRMIRISGFQEGKDIPIVFTGLRPGEKLTEELHDKDENLLSTDHPKIRKVVQRPLPLDRLNEGFDRLLGVVNGPAKEVTRLLEELVPEYTPDQPNSDEQYIELPSSADQPRVFASI